MAEAARPSARARAVPAASARRRPRLGREAAAAGQAEGTRDPWLGWAARGTLGARVAPAMASRPALQPRRWRKTPEAASAHRPEGRAGSVLRRRGSALVGIMASRDLIGPALPPHLAASAAASVDSGPGKKKEEPVAPEGQRARPGPLLAPG